MNLDKRKFKELKSVYENSVFFEALKDEIFDPSAKNRQKVKIFCSWRIFYFKPLKHSRLIYAYYFVLIKRPEELHPKQKFPCQNLLPDYFLLLTKEAQGDIFLFRWQTGLLRKFTLTEKFQEFSRRRRLRAEPGEIKTKKDCSFFVLKIIFKGLSSCYFIFLQ